MANKSIDLSGIKRVLKEDAASRPAGYLTVLAPEKWKSK